MDMDIVRDAAKPSQGEPRTEEVVNVLLKEDYIFICIVLFLASNLDGQSIMVHSSIPFLFSCWINHSNFNDILQSRNKLA